jgi:hypothetical protein
MKETETIKYRLKKESSVLAYILRQQYLNSVTNTLYYKLILNNMILNLQEVKKWEEDQ